MDSTPATTNRGGGDELKRDEAKGLSELLIAWIRPMRRRDHDGHAQKSYRGRALAGDEARLRRVRVLVANYCKAR